MHAAVVHVYGTPEYGPFVEPEAGGPGVVLDVLAAGVNNVDLVIARGAFPGGRQPPFVAGREGVGVIGDRRVYFDGCVGDFGSMAERTLVDPARVFPVPAGVDDGVATALGIAGLAGWLPLSWRGSLREGETVLAGESMSPSTPLPGRRAWPR